MIFLMPSFFASQSAHFGQGWGTIPILHQHIFGIFQAHPPYVSMNSTERQQKMVIFLIPPPSTFADVI